MVRPANFGMERTWPFPSCNNGAQMRGRTLRVASCCRYKLGHAAHSACLDRYPKTMLNGVRAKEPVPQPGT